jgi:DNA-binding transcriptional MerR regulator
MFTIGAFAEHGRVSVRMLRHYDAIGLLCPAHVDPATGYRYYRADQLTRLNRIIALKDLGFTLAQVRSILADDVGADEIRGMLRLRRAELETAVADAADRLARVEARLRTIESEHLVPTDAVVLKSLPPLRLAEVSGSAASFHPPEIRPAVTALAAQLRRRLDAAGIASSGPGITRYTDLPDGGFVVHIGLPVSAAVDHVEGVRIVEIPGVDRAATIVHTGCLDGVLPTVQALARWLGANGHTLSPQHSREVALARPADPHQWLTELQVPIGAAGV